LMERATKKEDGQTVDHQRRDRKIDSALGINLVCSLDPELWLGNIGDTGGGELAIGQLTISTVEKLGHAAGDLQRKGAQLGVNLLETSAVYPIDTQQIITRKGFALLGSEQAGRCVHCTA
ncbi:MAG: hypothetical protein ACRC8N_13945, partial [Aeromonas veronii]